MPHKRTSPLRRAQITSVAVLALGLGATAALAAPGDLDTTFDGDGIRTIDFLAGESAAAVLAQPDGKIVVAGRTGNTVTDNFVVTRLDPDGSLDSSFSGDGAASADFGAADWVTSAALQADGKIVVAGVTEPAGASSNVAVARFNANGTLDSSFDGDGMTTLDYLGGADAAEAVVLQPDGKIVLAGYGSSSQCFTLARLNPDGSPDPAFQGDDMIDTGSFCVAFGPGFDTARAAAIQPDGKIVIAGANIDGANENFAVTRIEPATGLPDRTFDGDGIRTIDFGGGDSAQSVLVQPNGKILLAGHGTGPGDFVVTRLDADGSTDQSFGGNGTANVDFGGSDRGYGAALQANGKIVLAGESIMPGGAALPVGAVARLQPGGALDTTFSGDGKQTVSSGAYSALTAATLQANGRILVAGGTGADMLVARLDGDSAAVGGGPARLPIGGRGGGPGGGPGGPGAGGGGRKSVPRCNGKPATIVGSTRSDLLKGTRRPDVIVALGGNDKIAAGGGNDTICAGIGNDTVDGGSGNDRLYGQAGKDKLGGGAGKDNLSGGAGKDNLSGGAGKDNLLGGGGRDKLNGGAGRDKQRQ
jgi:uncharacterized delta-60 repeat protein